MDKYTKKVQVLLVSLTGSILPLFKKNRILMFSEVDLHRKIQLKLWDFYDLFFLDKRPLRYKKLG